MTRAESVFTPPLNTSAITPTPGLDWLDIKDDASPADIFRAIGRLRKEARDEIVRLIDFLDQTDNHMELEPNGDEMDASWPECGIRPYADPHEDAEDDDPAEDEGTTEHSLGFLERHPSIYGYGRDGTGNQEWICQGLGRDLEEEHDGAEPDEADLEPRLGAPETFDQSYAYRGSINDLEQDDADSESDEPLLSECT